MLLLNSFRYKWCVNIVSGDNEVSLNPVQFKSIAILVQVKFVARFVQGKAVIGFVQSKFVAKFGQGKAVIGFVKGEAVIGFVQAPNRRAYLVDCICQLQGLRPSQFWITY